LSTSLSGLPSLESIRTEKARRHLRDFMRLAWHVVEPATPFVPGWHLDAICEHLEAVAGGQIRNLVINMPPRHAKSLTVAVFWPAWEWIDHPERRWLFASYADSLSLRDSVKCRRLIESPWYQERWGDRFRMAGDQNAKGRFENDKTGYRLASSVGGAVTGEGGDRVVVDDPHNVREIPSTTVRQAVLEWWDQAMSTRLNDPKTGARVIVMQRLHESDLSGHVLAQGGYDHLCLPAEYEGRRIVTSIGWSDPRHETGELLWSDRFGPDELTTLKRSLGSYGAAGQLQQRPSPQEGGVFKRTWWRFYDRLPERFDEIIQSWDMTFKKADDNDFVAGHVWGRIGADCYLLDRVHERMGFVETQRSVRALTAKWPTALTKLIEDKANGPAIIDSLGREIGGFIPVEPEGGKEARAAAVSPMVEAGNVWLPSPEIAPWVTEVIEESAAFPNAAHDDDVDAMSQALRRLSVAGGWLGWIMSEAESQPEEAGAVGPYGPGEGRRLAPGVGDQ